MYGCANCFLSSSAMSFDRISYAMLSDPGRLRRTNEDACAADLDRGVFVVCDGVGGAAGGEVASEMASQTFVTQMIAALEADLQPHDGILSGVKQANQAVHRRSLQTAALAGMATTMVALLFAPSNGDVTETSSDAGTIWLANIGDSRCYRLREGRLEQLTHDHSIVEEQVRSGAMTREQAEASPLRNVITRAVGSEAMVSADVQSLSACHGDLYLLTSDGLMKELRDEEIAALLGSGTPLSTQPVEPVLNELCASLVDSANQHGGSDNVTCLLVYVH